MAYPRAGARRRGARSTVRSGYKPKSQAAKNRASIVKLGRQLDMKTQYNYYSFKLIDQALNNAPYIIPVMNVNGWTQTFDVTASTTDKQLPQIVLKNIGFDFLITVDPLATKAESFTVFYVGLTKAGHAFFGGTVKNADMAAGQTHSQTGADLNVMLNKQLFNIKKVMRFSLCAKNYNEQINYNPAEQKKRVYHKESFNNTIKDTVSGWTSAADVNMPYYQKRYWLIFRNNLDNEVTQPDPKIHYQQMATICY